MRVVLAPKTEPLERPGTWALDEVRHLADRFPNVGLREVAVVRASELDSRADPAGETRVWLALEALQVTGSFKIRGALVAIAARAKMGATRVITASAGNHGAGVAYAARALGVAATVFVPQTAPLAKREKIEGAGAELVVVESDYYDDAEAAAQEAAARTGVPFLSAYDDIDIALGNGASLGFEIVRAVGGVPERVLVPIGGGGLATGMAWALAEEAVSDSGPRAVFGAQSEVSCACARSLETGVAVERDEPAADTLADGLAGGISAASFARVRRAVGGVVVVTEADIARAMAYAYKNMGVVLEGSAAVALAPVLCGLPECLVGGDLVVVLTGRNVDRARLESALSFC